MARICELTGKRPMKGSIIWRSGKSKKSGGIGTHITAITKRRFLPNLQRVKAVVDGEVRYVRVSTRALKRGLVVKAPKRTWKKSEPEKESGREQKPPASQLDAWVEEWRKANESFMHSIGESELGEEALKQAKTDGRVRFLGITGHHDPEILMEAMRRSRTMRWQVWASTPVVMRREVVAITG